MFLYLSNFQLITIQYVNFFYWIYWIKLVSSGSLATCALPPHCSWRRRLRRSRRLMTLQLWLVQEIYTLQNSRFVHREIQVILIDSPGGASVEGENLAALLLQRYKNIERFANAVQCPRRKIGFRSLGQDKSPHPWLSIAWPDPSKISTDLDPKLC